MARFSGPFSPRPAAQAPLTPAAPVRHPMERRTGWITAAAVPFLLGAFFQAPAELVADLAAFALMAGSARLTREGLRAEVAYDLRRIARRPAIPRKMFGAGLAGLGLTLGSWAPDATFGALLIGAAGVVLHTLAFGADPLRDKGAAGGFQQDRAARMIDEGQAHLDAMAKAVARTGERRLDEQVAGFTRVVHDLFRQVEQNPADLAGVRRYLGVWLMGAREATEKFADLYGQTRDRRLRDDWESLLNDLAGDFAARTRQLIEGGRTDLDIEMAVLRDRLAREGVRPALEQRDDPVMNTVLRDLDPARRGR